MRAIGIDLGTTNSLAAVGGTYMRVLLNRAGEILTPSAVSWVKKLRTQEHEIVVGKQARSYSVRAPEETILSIKRLMGKIYGDKQVSEIERKISYHLQPPPDEDALDQGVKVLLGGNAYTPVDISAMILKQIRDDAELALGESVSHAVITVPAYFEENQREATRAAGAQAGLTVLKIIDEPTAAAIFYGSGKEKERHRVLVYDLGGGTFDISIIQMVHGQFEVLEIQGNQWLGGDDFDQAIVKRMIDWVKAQYHFDPSSDKKFLGAAKIEAEKAKMALTVQKSMEIVSPLISKTPEGKPIDLEMELLREEFEHDISPLVNITIDLIQKALKNQNFDPEDISEVLLVGGSTSVPLVQKAVLDFFGESKVKRHINPMECVAQGAAILANAFDLEEVKLSDSSVEGPKLTEVTAMDFGIAAVKDRMADAFISVIPKGTPYPLSKPRVKTLYPSEENQSLLRVPVYEGDNEFASLNNQQGIIEFPLPRGIVQSTPVEVSFNYDENRVLTVGIRVVGTDLYIEKALDRNRPAMGQKKTKESIEEEKDWHKVLAFHLSLGKYFIGNYSDIMEKEDMIEFTKAIQLGEQALKEENEVNGRRASSLLVNKILGSGTATQIFLAERAMEGASPAVTQQLADGVAQLRSARKSGDIEKVQALSTALSLTVKKVRNERPQDVKDRERMDNLLEHKEV